jgi:hypothetical protein
MSKVVTNKSSEANRRSTSVTMRIDGSRTSQTVLIFDIISGSPGKGICIEGDINRVLYVLQRRYSITGTQDAREANSAKSSNITFQSINSIPLPEILRLPLLPRIRGTAHDNLLALRVLGRSRVKLHGALIVLPIPPFVPLLEPGLGRRLGGLGVVVVVLQRDLWAGGVAVPRDFIGRCSCCVEGGVERRGFLMRRRCRG